MGSAVNSSWSCVPEQTELKVGRNGVPAVIRGKHDSAEGVHILYKNMKLEWYRERIWRSLSSLQ